MRGSSSVGLGLSLVFGCLLLALVVELYYLISWKKKATNRDMIQESYTSPARELFYMFCCKRPSYLITQVHEPQAPSAVHPHLPRFLFTINEETKEEMESEDMSKRESRRSLSDVVSVDTPFFTPLASPPYLTPPINYLYRAFSPSFESSSDLEFNRIWASPPSKFKFLRDAEDKPQRKLMERFDDVDVDVVVDVDVDVEGIKDEKDGSFVA